MMINRIRFALKWVGKILPTRISLAVIGFSVILSFLPLIPVSLVVVMDHRVIYEHIVEGLEFEVDFLHSVNKGHIREVYLIDPNAATFTLEYAYFQNYGAGMLDVATETERMNFRQEGDYFVLDFPRDWRQSVDYIGGNIAKHVFIYGEDVILVGEAYPRKVFSISLSRRSFIELLLRVDF